MFKKLMGTKFKRSKNSSVRTFKVVNAVNTDGCATKFKHGRYTGNPQSLNLEKHSPDYVILRM